jgi:exodeoxyribonuclease VII large subunit
MRESLQTARRRAASYDRIGHLMDSSLAGKRHRMELLAGALAHLSPLARLSGGYGFVSGPDGRAIRTVTDLQEGDPFRVQLRDGRIDAAAVEIHPDGA